MKVLADYLFKDDSFDDESIDATDLIPSGSVEAVDFGKYFGLQCTEVWVTSKMRDGTFS
jgi:hypothetical protein